MKTYVVGTSNEYHNMFSPRNKKNIYLTPTLIKKYESSRSACTSAWFDPELCGS